MQVIKVHYGYRTIRADGKVPFEKMSARPMYHTEKWWKKSEPPIRIFALTILAGFRKTCSALMISQGTLCQNCHVVLIGYTSDNGE